MIRPSRDSLFTKWHVYNTGPAPPQAFTLRLPPRLPLYLRLPPLLIGVLPLPLLHLFGPPQPPLQLCLQRDVQVFPAAYLSVRTALINSCTKRYSINQSILLLCGSSKAGLQSDK